MPAGRSAANSSAAVAAVNRWDRRTEDGCRPLHRPFSAYYAGSVNKAGESRDVFISGARDLFDRDETETETLQVAETFGEKQQAVTRSSSLQR